MNKVETISNVNYNILDCDMKVDIKRQFISFANSKDVSKDNNLPFLKNFSGTDFEHDVEIGNICVIGNDADTFGLISHIISYFEVRNHHLEPVTSAQFLRAGRSADFSDRNYLINMDPAHTSGNRVRVITDHCSTTFISHISPVASVINRLKYNRIVGSLGRNFSKRKAMLDSLKQNEFLIINKDNERIFSLDRRLGDE